MSTLFTCSAIVLLQDLMPLVTSKDVRPGTRLTQYYQSWWLGHAITLTAQRKTVVHKKRVSNETSYISSPKDWRSSTISQPHGGWFSQEHRPEIKFLQQRDEAHSATKKPGCPHPRKQWDTLVSPLCKDFPMCIVLSHHWLRKNIGEWASQTRLMITTSWQFSWKHNTVEYLWDTVTNPHVNAKGLWLQHEHMRKYML